MLVCVIGYLYLLSIPNGFRPRLTQSLAKSAPFVKYSTLQAQKARLNRKVAYVEIFTQELSLSSKN